MEALAVETQGNRRAEQSRLKKTEVEIKNQNITHPIVENKKPWEQTAAHLFRIHEVGYMHIAVIYEPP